MDTVIVRVHNVKEKYPIIWQLCQDPKTGKHQVNVSGVRPKEVVDTVGKFYLNYDNQSAIPVIYSDKTKIASSNHDIRYHINQHKEYLEINISVPKYLFGNNVLEVITPPGDKNYSVNLLSPFAHVKFWHKLLREIIEKLVYQIAKNNYLGEFGDERTGKVMRYGLDWNDVEINRIDFCVNQYFQSKVEALKYLKAQGGIHKRHARKDAGNEVVYQGQTLMFKSEHYMVKIYHKGSEFANLQGKHIMQLNEDRKKEARLNGKAAKLLSSNIEYAAQHVKNLQEISDRILRYEFTFRPSFMSYLFNRRMNKFWCTDFQIFRKIFDYIKEDVNNKKFILQHKVKYVDEMGFQVDAAFAGAKQKYFVEDKIELFYQGSDIWKDVVREFTEKEYKFFAVLRKYGIVNRKDLTMWLHFIRKELQDVRQMRWRIDGVRDTMRKVVKNEKDEILYVNNAMSQTGVFSRFSVTTMNSMLVELEKFFNNFQIDSKDTISEFAKKIIKWNQLINDKLKLVGLDQKENDKLKKLLVNLRTERALMEFNILSGKMKQKELREKYQKTTYFRLAKLYKLVSGQSFNISIIDFGAVNREFKTCYKCLHQELEKGFLLNFYKTAFAGHYACV